jgi:dTDP-4-dehydrorhamnose reductase
MRLLITGAAGMLGQDVAAAAARSGHEVVALARAGLDITDRAAVRAAIAEARPAAIVNCAAWTDVDGAEADEAAATRINGDGAGNVAAEAAATGAFLVHVSSDYVFDGRATTPYLEDAGTAPISAYGRSKLAGERAVAAAGGAHAIVRSSWLFGTGGRNFVDTMIRLGAERDELRVVDDQRGCPTFTGHLAQALVAVAERRPTGVLHAAGRGETTWFELARATFEKTGAPVHVEPCTTAEFPRPAPRPAYSVLGSARTDAPTLPSWRDGLRAYLRERAGAAITEVVS